MMKNLVVALAVVALIVSSQTTSVAAGDGRLAQDGNLSANQLADAGLGGMSVMSDRQGEAVRGKGYVRTWSRSYVSGATYQNQFTIRKHNFSFSKSYAVNSNSGAYSFGYAFAYAH